MGNYQEQLRMRVASAKQDKDLEIKSYSSRLLQLFTTVSSLLREQHVQPIPLVSQFPLHHNMKFRGVDVLLNNGDTVELARDERTKHVLIGILAQVDESDAHANAGGIWHEQTVLTLERDKVVSIDSVNSTIGTWKNVDPGDTSVNRNLDTDIAYLEAIFTSAQKKLTPGGPATG